MNNQNVTPSTIRRHLLSTASALALITSVCGASKARAEDADRPLIWIELGGQVETIDGQGKLFAPPFLAANPSSSVLQKVTPVQAQKPPLLNFGEEAKIYFQPENTDWVISAAIRYGRSGGSRRVHHQTDNTRAFSAYGVPTLITTIADFADTKVERSEKYDVLDFSAGKDVGLGLFGKSSASQVSLGVRFAQFAGSESVDIRARPDLYAKYITFGPRRGPLPKFHLYHYTGESMRSFRGIGPSISWAGSTSIAGNLADGELAVDWGANAALLFGKQRARVHHHQVTQYESALAGIFHPSVLYTTSSKPPGGHNTLRSVTTPNVGGSIGLTWRVQDFKFSLGYRYDAFFKAMDTGIDARETSNVTFNGPYASISIGLGD